MHLENDLLMTNIGLKKCNQSMNPSTNSLTILRMEALSETRYVQGVIRHVIDGMSLAPCNKYAIPMSLSK